MPSCIGRLVWLPKDLYGPRTSEASRGGTEEQWGLSERLTAVPQSRCKCSGLLRCLQVADGQLKLAVRGYDGCVILKEG